MSALQTLIRRRKAMQYRETSLLKACKNLLSQAPPPPPPPLKPPAASSLGEELGLKEEAGIKRYENPCLDLYFNVIPKRLHPTVSVISKQQHPTVSRGLHLNRFLPLAWSHDPLTTLKIIRTLREDKVYTNTAMFWLHDNHPKTLDFNLPYLVGGYQDLRTIPYSVLDWTMDPEHLPEFSASYNGVIDLFQTLVVEHHTEFRFLHDRISDVFAEGLKFDIQNLIINSSRRRHDDEEDDDVMMEFTDASKFCSHVPFLLESIAERLFPASGSVEEAVERLRKEVLEPLRKVLDDTNDDQYGMNPWGYRCVHDDDTTEDPYFVWNKYLKEAEEDKEKMVANALLPYQIVLFVDHRDLRQAVELQWKMMVEDLKKKHMETLRHRVVVIHPNKYMTSLKVRHALAMSLTILVSELSEEEAWKGKFIPLIPRPRLVSIRGDDLKSKCRFLREGVVANQDYSDFKSVFDLILQEAVDRSLKPDQMIKRLYVLTQDKFALISSDGELGMLRNNWEAEDYEDMKSKYKEHGYDIPHIVSWGIGVDHLEHVQHTPDERGIITINRLNVSDNYAAANFVNMFLENDGVMTPQHIMEANIAHQAMAVLD